MPTYEVDVGGRTYEVDAPDPDTAWHWANQTHAQKNQAASQAGDKTERTWGEAAGDVGASIVSGVGSLVQLPGQLYGLATGDFSDTGALGLGKDIQEAGEAMKSKGLKAREEQRSAAVAEAEKSGQLDAFLTALGETATDPALLTTFLAEQAPQLIPMILTGGLAGAIARKGVMNAAAARGAAEEAAKRLAAKKSAEASVATAIGTGAAMQGADIGAGAYDEIFNGLKQQGLSDVEAANGAINAARAAGVTGAALSVLANRFLPGGRALERVLAGKATGKGMIVGAGAGALKEIPSEVTEEVGGRFAQNVAARSAGLERDLTSGLGETAAMSALGAIGMGGVTGAFGGRGAKRPDEEETKGTTDQTQDRDLAGDTEEDINTALNGEEPTGEPTEEGDVFEAFGERPPAPQKTEAEKKAEAALAEEEGKLNTYKTQIAAMEQRLDLSASERKKLGELRGRSRNVAKNVEKKREALEAERQRAAAQSGQQTTGAGVSIPVSGSSNVPTTQGTVGADGAGVVPTGQVITTTVGAEGTQQPAVSFEERMRTETDESLEDIVDPASGWMGAFDDAEVAAAKAELARRKATQPTAPTVSTTTATPPTATDQQSAANQTVKAVKRDTKADNALLDSLFGDDQLPSRGAAEMTPDQRRLNDQLNVLGKTYGVRRAKDEGMREYATRVKKAIAFEETLQTTPVTELETAVLAGQELREQPPITIPAQMVELYEETREAFNQRDDVGEEGDTDTVAGKEGAAKPYKLPNLPAFDKLSPDEKIVYFRNNISRNTQEEHDTAAEQLANYIGAKQDESRYARKDVETPSTAGIMEEKLAPIQKEIKAKKEAAAREAQAEIKAKQDYSRERGGFGRKTGLSYSFPEWNTLSDESRKVFMAINKTGSAAEQFAAFRAVKKQIQKELAEKQRVEFLTAAQTRAEQETQTAAERAQAAQPAGKGATSPRLAAVNPETGKTSGLLFTGTTQQVLRWINEHGQGIAPKIGYDLQRVQGKTGPLLRRKLVRIRDSVSREIFRNLAGALMNVEGLQVNVVYDPNMVYDNIAQYDANTNTLYVGPKGLDEATILHELVHAGTVKLIHQYFTDKTKLDPRHIASIEHLIKIAGYAKRSLGAKYPNAFENIYEFVAYAMTDLKFQEDLAQIQVPSIAKATAKTGEQNPDLVLEREVSGKTVSYDSMFDTLWDAFTGTLAYMYGVFRPMAEFVKYLMPTDLSWAVNPGKGLTGEAREKAIRKYNEAARAEKELGLSKKEKAYKKALERIDAENAALDESEQMSESERFDRAIELAEELSRPVVATDESLFDDPEAEETEGRQKIKEDLITERGITSMRRMILRSPGFKGNLLLEASAAFQEILAAPEGGIERLGGIESGVPTSTLAATRKQAPQTKLIKSPEDMLNETQLDETSRLSNVRTISKWLSTRKAYNTLRQKFANSRDPIMRWEKAIDRAGKLWSYTDKLNNVYGQLTLSAALAKDKYLTKLANPENKLREAIGTYAKAMKVDTKRALEILNLVAQAKHEPERRQTLFMLTAPLSIDKKNITLPTGKTVNMSPAELRSQIMEAVLTGKLNGKTVSNAQVERLKPVLMTLVADPKNLDPKGMSGFSEESRAGKTSTDINSEQYSVIGYSPAEIQEFEKKYYNDNNPKAKAAADAVLDALREVQKSTIELNREGNYWSAPVERLVKFYGWQNYVPLKGTQKDVDSRDTFLDINRSPRLGGELQEAESAFGGRVTPSDNAILQSLVEATKAAMRAGRKDVTLAIKNAVEQKLLMGEVGAPVPFEDRYKLGKEAIKKNKTLVFHYNPDGSITPISLTDRVQREAIKRTYEESQPLINMLNWATSHLGMFHTRYNIAFGPMNFIRDALTNAFTIGAEMSPIAAGQYIGAVSRIVSTKMHKAAQVAILYENGKFDQIEAMAKKDPFVQDLYEYIQSGGKISYLQGLTTKAQQKELQADILSGSTSKATKAINRVFDYYMDTFEMASRAASYHVSKRQFMAELNEQRKPKTQAEKAAVVEEARVKATAYTKNLANFEQVGQWGKAAGAYFMFFRPAATGAIRAIDAIGPALRSVESAKKELPAVVLNDPEAVKRFEAKYKEQQKAARAMSVALMGFGAAVYYMAYALADDDDQGRNRVATDDPDRWSRYARLFIPGFENPIQMPWGFGLGAFAAAGAQFASIGDSNTIGGALKNIVFNIGMDAFLPLPVSRISPIEHPSMWLMDTALPSALRPLLEHTMNMNALGQQIYNNRQSRYGDAYTGGDKIPEAYKAAARTLYDITGGAVDWSPNSLYFFANNYADGPSRLLNGIVDIGLTAAGEKEFNPRTDTLAFTSFFGAPSNYDAKQFSDIQEKVLRIKQRLDTMEVNSPDKYAEYVGNNPEHYAAVKIYDKQINGMLREIQQQTNEVRRMPGLSIKERQQMIEDLVNVQNSIKAGLVQTFEAYGVKP